MKKNIAYLGFVILVLNSCSCNNDKPIDEQTTTSIKQLSYSFIAKYPHDSTAFTEGLEWHDGFLYEGTGDTEYKGVSKLAKVDLKTGKNIQKINLSKDYFGEGITILNNKIYQLTYKTEKAFVYNATTFTKEKEFTYKGEGWGLTNDGKQLIMSNGSSDIVYRNPETFEITKTITVTNDYGPVSNINELEYINGFLFANVWTTNRIIKIDLATGKVVAEINFDDLLPKYAPEIDKSKIDVFNGIAYDSVGKRFFLTGKNYPALFEVKINE